MLLPSGRGALQGFFCGRFDKGQTPRFMMIESINVGNVIAANLGGFTLRIPDGHHLEAITGLTAVALADVWQRLHQPIIIIHSPKAIRAWLVA
jgi:hypothetical protein